MYSHPKIVNFIAEKFMPHNALKYYHLEVTQSQKNTLKYTYCTTIAGTGIAPTVAMMTYWSLCLSNYEGARLVRGSEEVCM